MKTRPRAATHCLRRPVTSSVRSVVPGKYSLALDSWMRANVFACTSLMLLPACTDIYYVGWVPDEWRHLEENSHAARRASSFAPFQSQTRLPHC